MNSVYAFHSHGTHGNSYHAHLYSWRDVMTQKMFQDIKDPKHHLHYLLKWPTYPYQLPLSESSRYGREFIPYSISKKSKLF